jgi:hypothetical protein
MRDGGTTFLQACLLLLVVEWPDHGGAAALHAVSGRLRGHLP